MKLRLTAASKTGFCIAIALLGLLSSTIIAQEVLIQGKIRDKNTHREISEVNIYIDELGIGTVSNTIGRFELKVASPDPEMTVIFQHIAFDTLQISLEEALSRRIFYLNERIISLPLVEIESIEQQLNDQTDLPQMISILDARAFDLRGYIDAGDLLRTDHSILVDEELSGRKTVAIRGGSPDEVIVLYNGIKMNNTLDNIFDLSLIDLGDVERLEIIKGSNTTLYGPEAFSGVINVVPRAQQDYNVRFHQRIGSYDSGGWGMNLYKQLGKFHASYGLKRGSSRRKFDPPFTDERLLINNAEHHSASLVYNFSETAAGKPRTSLGMMFVSSDLVHENERDNELLDNFNRMVSMRFNSNPFGIGNFTLTGAYQWLDENQFLKYFEMSADSGFVSRDFADRAWHLNAQKSLNSRYLSALLGYQFKQSEFDFRNSWFAFSDAPNFTELATLDRQHHGFIGLINLRIPTEAGILRRARFDVSVRYDQIRDRQFENQSAVTTNLIRQPVAEGLFENKWQEGSVKFSTSIMENLGSFAYRTFLNFGTNVKFPTLLQQISTREAILTESTQQDLSPEKNRSVEIGLEFTRELREAGPVNGWKFTGSFFRNSYQDKFISYYLPGTPIALYENVSNADITGFEGKQAFYFFRKRLTMEFGGSRYLFSDASVFPFKQDRKYTINVMLDQAGYSLQLHGYREGEKIAQIRDYFGNYLQETVPEHTNVDLHFSKTFEAFNTEVILNTSIRNLMDDDFTLGGLPLRDRRYYLTLGIQY